MPFGDLPLPSAADAVVVVPAPGPGSGSWAGAASACVIDGEIWLTYRLRHPVGRGRGVQVVVARSADGVDFEQVCTVHRDDFGAESFERPVVLRRPDGGWRLYLSCATPDSKHWWIEALDADEPADLPDGRRTVVLGGDEHTAVKDPVIRVSHDRWQMWVCEHPLTEPGHEDRMSTAHLTSDDGVAWRRHGTVLAPRAGAWDARGARVTAVLRDDPLVVLYDGRAAADDNWHEATGVARADASGRLVPDDEAGVLRSPWSDGALRYASVVPTADGGTRFYVELARADGAHDLVTSLGRSGA